MFIPPNTSVVVWSFTWVYNVTFDPTKSIDTGDLINDVIQCADPSNCPGATSVDGVSIKAADFAKCGFTGTDENGGPLNPTSIVAGTDIKVRCEWDKVQLKYSSIINWEQGQKGFDINSPAGKLIKTQGFPNNSHVRSYPFDCMSSGSGQIVAEKDAKKMNWRFMILKCDQQFNGMGT